MTNAIIPNTLIQQLEAIARRENRTPADLLSEMLDQRIPSTGHPTTQGPLTIADLGWTPEQAAAIRAQLAAFADDWDDPAMDVYDEL